MTQESIQPVLNWITANPTWAGFIVFLISLSESLAIVGLVVPGVVMMTAIGAMMGSGHLPFWETLTWAILGAIAGDGISYWLGYHYHEHLREFWPFKQFPKLLARGEAFFKNHGGKSIIFGRFVGPVRPMIPVIAGMMDMTPRRFLVFNILSAIAWAPLYSLPGILIGASLGNLSSEVATRIGMLVLLALFAIWVVYEIILLIGSWISKTVAHGVDYGWRLLSRLPWVHPILRTAQGSEQSQLGILILFLIGLCLFLTTLSGVLNSSGIANWDEPVFQVLRALYNEKIIKTSELLTAMGDPWILLPTIAAVGLWLLWRQRYKTALCWLFTIGGGFALGHFLKIATHIPRPEGLGHLNQPFAFPSGHALAATLTFGMAAVLIQHSVAKNHRWIPWAVAIPLIFIAAFSRLYLGMHWFTDVIGSITLGICCVTLGAFIYQRIEPRPIPIRAVLIPGLITFVLCFSIYSFYVYPKIHHQFVRQWPKKELIEESWWQGHDEAIRTLYRTGALKRQATVFDIQWLGSLDKIRSILEGSGFTEVPKLNFKTGVMILANDPSPLKFPVLPKFHRDRLPVLIFAKQLDNNKRVIVQLWDSDYVSDKKLPLWVGTLRLEEANHPLPLVTLYLEESSETNLLEAFTKTLKNDPALHWQIINPENPEETKVLLLKSS